MTNIRPSDYEEGPPLVIQLEKPNGFNFSKLKKGVYLIHLSRLTLTLYPCILDPALQRQIAGFMFDYIFKGNPRSIGNEDAFKLVEYGVARFGLLEKFIIDEPMALLAATHYFTTQTPWCLQHFLLEAVSPSDSAIRGKGLEHLGVYLIAEAFKTPRRLSDIFEFIDANDLGNEFARLVCINKVGENVSHAPLNLLSDERDTYIVGCSASSEAETLSWLQNPNRTAFCFPAHTVGTDAILFLLLSGGYILRVFIQWKYTTGLGPQPTADAYRTTDPTQFISRLIKPGDRKPASPQAKTQSSAYVPQLVSMMSSHSLYSAQPKATYLKNPERTEELLTALKNLGPVPPKAGDFGVLRVLATYPGKPHAATLSQAVKDDQCKHPGATLDMTSKALAPREVDYLRGLERRVVAEGKQRKMKGKGAPMDVMMQDKDKMDLD
jgi:hypothetical protein